MAKAWDGFDTYNGTGTLTGVQAKWIFSGPDIGRCSMQTGVFAGQRLRCGQEHNGSSNTFKRYYSFDGSAFTFGFYFRVAGGTGLAGLTGTDANSIFVHVMNGNTYMLGLNVKSNGSIGAWRTTAERTGTQLGSYSATGVIVADTDHYVEFSGTIHDSTGTVVVKVDGTTVLNLSGQDTRNGTPTTVDAVQLQSVGGYAGNASILFDFDHTYFMDSDTGLGASKVETLYPTSDVAQGFSRSTGSANYALVDDTTVNGDSDYVESGTVNTVDTYGFGNLSSNPDTIHGVQLVAFVKNTDAGARSAYLQAISDGTTSDGTAFGLPASYGRLERPMLTDPDTSAAWTYANVNALEAGPKVAA